MRKNVHKDKLIRKKRRRARARGKIHGTAKRPRLCLNRSLRYVSAQAIDDDAGETLYSLHESNLKLKGTKTERAQEFAKQLAQGLKKNKIDQIVFDRGPYKYHGRVKAVAETLRQEDIKF